MAGFDKVSTENLKVLLSGFDDMIQKFPEIKDEIYIISYNPKKKVCGVISSKTVEISKKGLNYETAIHESAHAVDFARSFETEYSDKIVEQARKNLKLRKNSKEYSDLRNRIVGYNQKDVMKNKEVFAYSIETEAVNPKKGNKLSKEIFKLFMEE